MAVRNRYTWALAVVPLAAACRVTTSTPAAPARLPIGADSASEEQLARGVVHRRLVVNGVPWVIHVLELDLRRKDVQLRAEHAFGRSEGRERTSVLARRLAGDSLELLAAVNADFFNLATGEVVNNQVVEGQIVTGVGRALNPARPPRSHFALTRTRRPLIERFEYAGTVWVGADSFPLAGVNVPVSRGTMVLRSWPSADTLARDTTGEVRALPLLPASRDARSTGAYVVAGPLVPAAEARMPAHGALLVVRGAPATRLARLLESDRAARPTVRVAGALTPSVPGVRTVVGGWTRLLKDGVAVADSAWAQEGAARAFVVGRNPRTAVGISRDSLTLYLVTVDGRQARSAGMTLAELASVMRGLGSYQAVNLDGGGSTAMVIRGVVVNTPSDTGGERAVGNALVVVKKR